MRANNRKYDELRPIKIFPDFLDFADGSALIEWGKTRVVAAATIEEKVPPFLKNTGSGWVTAEYSMLPRATEKRTNRERNQGYSSGRSQEIQRLIGRTLRAVTDLRTIGERPSMRFRSASAAIPARVSARPAASGFSAVFPTAPALRPALN